MNSDEKQHSSFPRTVQTVLAPSEQSPLTRRAFTRVLAAALPAVGLFSVTELRGADASARASGKPNSKVNGVQIGLNVPYSFANATMSGDDILKNCMQLELSGVELRTQPVEAFLGLPTNLVTKKNTSAELAEWRKSAPLDKAKEFRKNYETAGVRIEIVKVDGIFSMAEGEIDYFFALAKALGGRAISTEISKKEEDLQRIGQFADKHRLMVGYHGHAETKPEDWEKAFSLAKYNGANVDLGHFVAGNDTSPLPFIKEHHDRITHVHVKDRKKNNGPNTVFGEGDTPIKEVLQLLKEKQWPIQATIEFEYKVPLASDRMTEIARCVQYCREALA
jgi:sugar phosphate isomerase/epimerase